MSNEVEVDEEALRAQAAALDIGAEPQPGAEPVADVAPETGGDEVARAEAFARQSAPVIGKLLRGVAAVAVPNWEITSEQHEGLASSVSFALALWFPHEIPPKWAALVGVGMSVYAIAEANRDPSTGALKPRVKPRTATTESDGAGNQA